MRIRQVWANRLGIAVVGLLLPLLAWQASFRPIDFPVYHGVATSILHGDWGFYPTDYDGPEPVSGHAFRYAPAVGLLFVPFGLLPLEAAAFAFFCLKLGAFWYIFSVVSRRMGVPERSSGRMLISALLVSGYLAEEFRNGNFHFLMAALLVLAFDRAERGKIVIPALSLAVAIAAKITPIVLLAYFVLKRRVAVSVATVAMLAVLWALPAAIIGFEANQRLFQEFARYAVQKIDEEGNYSLRGVLLRHLGDNPGRDPKYPDTSIASLPAPVVSTLWVALVLGGAGFLAVVFARAPRSPAHPLLDLSLLLTAILLASPHTQRIHFSAVFVPVAVLLALLAKHPAMPFGGAIRVALAVTAGASTFLPAVLGSRQLALAYEASSPYFLATLILFALLAALAIRFSPPRQRSEEVLSSSAGWDSSGGATAGRK